MENLIIHHVGLREGFKARRIDYVEGFQNWPGYPVSYSDLTHRSFMLLPLCGVARGDVVEVRQGREVIYMGVVAKYINGVACIDGTYGIRSLRRDG